MAQAFNIEIQGLKELQDRMKAAPANIRKYIAAEVRDGAQAIAAEAKQRAPGDTGILRNLIAAAPINDLTWEVVSAANYSAYVEFGTGTEVFETDLSPFSKGATPGLYSFTEDEKEYASQFFVNGKGYMPPHPYFFVTVHRITPIIVERMKKVLDKI